MAANVIRDGEFAKRLNMACESHPRAPSGWGIQAWLRRELENEGVKVYPEAVRKWFAGESRPKMPIVTAIAKILSVDEAWLSLGIKPAATPGEKIKTNAMANGAINLVAGQIQLAGGVIAYPEGGSENDLFAIIQGRQVAISIRLGDANASFVLNASPRAKVTVAVVPTDNPTQFRFLSVPGSLIEKHGSMRGGYADVELRRSPNGTYRIGKSALPEILDFAHLSDVLKESDGISDGIDQE